MNTFWTQNMHTSFELNSSFVSGKKKEKKTTNKQTKEMRTLKKYHFGKDHDVSFPHDVTLWKCAL